MFAAAASGVLLPPYVVYKSENIMETWKEGGPRYTRYNRSKSGWFTREIFQDWFHTIAVPYFKHRERQGTKVLLGDNLASHMSYSIIAKALELNIHFVFLPPNSTDKCQPLDVCVFKAVKSSWSTVLTEWKAKNRGSIPKSVFPSLLKATLERTVNMESNIKSGFRKTGLFPFNPDVVLKTIPHVEDEVEIGRRYLEPVSKLLHKHRCVLNVFLCSRYAYLPAHLHPSLPTSCPWFQCVVFYKNN